MLNVDLPLAWDSLDEKTVQAAIHHRYPNLEREVNLSNTYLDFLTRSHFCIELKKSSSSQGSRYLTRPSHAIGQVLGYVSEYSYLHQVPLEEITPVILLYGSSIGRWLSDDVTRLRKMVGCKLWVLVSLANAEVLDLDSEQIINLGDL